MTSLAIMQPYFFPYIGYYQLVNATDSFVFLDDAAFIKNGYINRNSILLNNQAHRFTLSIANPSSFRTIREHMYRFDVSKLMELMRHAYSRAPFYTQILDLVRNVINVGDTCVSKMNAHSISQVFQYLGIQKSFFFSSEAGGETGLKGQARVIEICLFYEATTYINSPGGKLLYDKESFAKHDLELKFIEPELTPYKQTSGNFVEGLSMLDVMMWNSPNQIIDMLKRYRLASSF